MSNLFGMIYMGVSGINAAQVGQDVTGNNINNLKTEGYSRQIVSYSTMKPQIMGRYVLGRGVQVAAVQRVTDELLVRTVNQEKSSYTYFQSMQTTVKESMLYFDELAEGSGLGDSLKGYFDAWQKIASTAPDASSDSTVMRIELIEKAQTLASKIREGYASIEDVRSKSDTIIKNEVASINDITKSIANLNKAITESEVSGAMANDLRDARDTLVSTLAGKANINTYEKENGQVTVFIGTQALVDGNVVHELQALPNPDKQNHLDVYFSTGAPNEKPTNITNTLTNGNIGAQIKTRDEILPKYLNQLDSLAKSLISQTNKLHSTGQGLQRFSNLQGGNPVDNPLQVLSTSFGTTEFPVTTGTFSVDVYDADGNVVKTISIDVDPNTDTLANIALKINAQSDGYLTAKIDGDNKFNLTTNGAMTFAFTNDTSNFLVGAGLNTFFSGTSAADIDLSSFISDNPSYIATGKTGAPGDNTNAKLMADMQSKNIVMNNGTSVTIDGFYGYFIGTMSSDKSQIDTYTATKKMSYGQVSVRLESIRGVSESEELVNMSIFQRTFEANSRFINTVDEMINTIVNGLGAGR